MPKPLPKPEPKPFPKPEPKPLPKPEPEVKEILEGLKKELAGCEWPLGDFFSFAKEFAESRNLGVGKVMKPLRCALTGELGGPELLDVLNFQNSSFQHRQLFLRFVLYHQ